MEINLRSIPLLDKLLKSVFNGAQPLIVTGLRSEKTLSAPDDFSFSQSVAKLTRSYCPRSGAGTHTRSRAPHRGCRTAGLHYT